ncbi:MAG: hypothetical protein KGZ94_11440 [Clostridia bacterium]|nr:hypothetical protein [Clostridia bacterium]
MANATGQFCIEIGSICKVGLKGVAFLGLRGGLQETNQKDSCFFEADKDNKETLRAKGILQIY